MALHKALGQEDRPIRRCLWNLYWQQWQGVLQCSIHTTLEIVFILWFRRVMQIGFTSLVLCIAGSQPAEPNRDGSRWLCGSGGCWNHDAETLLWTTTGWAERGRGVGQPRAECEMRLGPASMTFGLWTYGRMTDIQISKVLLIPGEGWAKRSCTRPFRAILGSRAKVLAPDHEKTHGRPDLCRVHCREQGTLDQVQLNCNWVKAQWIWARWERTSA